MRGRMHGRAWRVWAQRRWLGWVCGHAPLAWGNILWPLGGAMFSAALVLAWLLPSLREDLQFEQEKLRQMRMQGDAARARLHQAESSAQAQLPTSDAKTMDAAPARSPWQWQQMALAAGLAVEQLKPVQVAGTKAAQVLLRLRGRYAQQASFVAGLSDPALAVRLLRYQLQSGAGGMHLAELALEGSASAAQAMPWPGPSTRPYRASPERDPLSEPPPADPLATLPAQWRAEFQRPKELLEIMPLTAFTLVGTLNHGGQWRALLQSERVLHTLQVGDRLGQDLGRVQRIAEQGLWLREVLRDPEGQWAERERLWRVGERP